MRTIVTLTAILFLSSIFGVFAQKGIVNNGAKIIVSSGAVISVEGGSDADYTNKTSGIKHGRIDLDGKMKIEGDWANNATSGTVFINTDTDGEVVFQGTNAKSISGNATGFEKLNINTSGGVSLAANTTVNGTLALNNGLLNIGAKNLTLSATSTILGTPSSTKMIVANSTGELRKIFSTTGSFTFPVGDNTSTVEYSPITLNFTGGTFGSSAYASVKLSNSKHASNATTGSYINRYWTLGQYNISSYTYNVTGTYLQADVVGTETSLFSGYWNGTRWVKLNSVNSTSNYVTGTLTSMSDITAGDQEMFCTSGISISRTLTNISCNGGNNGAINITVSDGYAPYTYYWETVDGSGLNATAEDQTGLTAGTYNITVTDANGCTQTDMFTLTEPLELTSSYVLTHVSCNGGSNGIVNLSVSGGTTPYYYNWSNSATTQDINSLIAGTYNVTITDNKGCVTYNTATITEPDALAIAPSVVDVSCNGLSDGSASANASGGTSPYTYQWNDAFFQATATATGLAAGTYGITVQDNNGCTINSTATVDEPNALVLSSGTTNASCGLSDGSATVSLIGGTSPYNYSWSTGSNTTTSSTSNTVSSLPAANYDVTVTDANGCFDEITITLNEETPPSLSISASTNVSCNGGTDGTATVGVTGGETPYTYSWSNSQTAITATGLSATSYTVTVTDNNNCSATTSVTITEPAILNANISASTAVSCNGLSDGTATVSVSGGTTLYGYLWDDGETGATATALDAGLHVVTVTDANGCTDDASITISEPALLVASGVGTDVLCNGGTTGSIALTVTGGTLPNTYAWSNSATTEDLSGLSANTYTVTVTDAHGCEATTSVDVLEPTALTVTPIASAATCNGSNNGSVDANAGGGVTPYTYQWNDASFQTTAIATNLLAGTYNVVVTDANGCTTNNSGEVTQPTAIVLGSSTTNSSCNTADGTATVTVTGGVSPFDYVWSSGGSTLASALTSNTENGLFSGSYTVTVTDANGCFKTKVITVSDATGPSASILASTNVSCNGGSNGTITVQISGGTPNYNYAWSNGSTTSNTASLTNIISGLGAETYSVTVTDFNNCSATASVEITEPSILNANISTSTAVSCNGLSDGTATVSVSGGTTPYGYLWDNSETGATATVLDAGSHTVVITDANGCIKNTNITITEPALLVASGVGTDVLCNGGSTGSIALTVTGGTLPNTYVWSNSATTEDLSGLSANTYTVTVTDAHGCEATTSVDVLEPTALTTSPIASAATCNGSNNGSIDANAGGGVTPYTYQWNDASFQTTAIATNLLAGTYNVVVTDANGCTANNSGEVTQPDAIVLTSSTTNSSCSLADGSATVNVSGGTSPFDYIWSSGGSTLGSALTSNTESALASGTYNVTVTDVNGCSEILAITVSDASGPSVSVISSSNVSCNGGNNGSATIEATGGATPYTYEWSNGQTVTTATGLSASTYTITVTDNNNCTASTSVTITQPTVVNALVTASTIVSCNGFSDGTATVNVSGGTGVGTYSYLWDNSETGVTAITLSAGIHGVIVTDANSCKDTAYITILEPEVLEANGVGVDALCNGSSDGYIDLSVTGGTTPYSFSWSNGDSDEDINGLVADTYTVTVTDTKGCEATTSVTINEPTNLILGLSGVDVTCYGYNNGAITTSISGGTTPYTYLWNDGISTSNRSNIYGGVYTITVTDGNGCQIFDNITISQPDELVLSTSVNNVSCYLAADGSIDLSVAGGTTPYSYSWDSGETTEDISLLSGGEYNVEVLDFNSCSATTLVTITEPDEILLSVDVVNETCTASNGTATVNVVSGGVIPFTYLWDAGAGSQSTQIATNLAAGIYDVTVQGSNGCQATAQAILENYAGPTISISSSDPLCNNDCNGSAVVNISGGTAPFTIVWGGGESTATISNLCAGNYAVTVSDANMCQASDNIELINPTILASTITSNDVTCYGSCNGTASVSVTGGTSTYTYHWTNGAISSANSNLCAGVHYVTIQDGNACQLIDLVSISEPTEIMVSINSENVTCNGLSDGNISLTVSGGVAPYTYSWLSGENTSDLTNIAAGTYNVTISDNLNCTLTEEIEITEPDVLTASIEGANISCYGLNDGTANLTVLGGTLPYTYSWDNGAVTEDISMLDAGTYNVNILDSNNCVISTSIDITQPDSLIASVIVTDISCNGGNSGSIDLTISGGTLPYTYLWDNGALTEDILGLVAGTYSAQVLDSNACVVNVNAEIIEPTAIEITYSVTDEVFGGDGAIDLTVSGGVTPYTYDWGGGITDEDLANIVSGLYSVTVTDASLCTASASIVVNNAGCLLAADIITTSTSCYGSEDGEAQVSIIDGVEPFTFSWSNGENTGAITSLLAGTYSVTITDSLGCNLIKSAVVTEPGDILSDETINNVLCYGDATGDISVLISGGTSPYNLSWNTGDNTNTIDSLVAGNYFVTIEDANSCISYFSYQVTQNSQIVATETINNEVLGNDGSIELTVSGGVSPYTYSWNGGEITSLISGLSIGTYVVTITDANSCDLVESYIVNSANCDLDVILSSTTITCNGAGDGSINTNIIGGTSPFTYVWSNSETTENITNLAVGEYFVTVQDSIGCQVVQSIMIIEPDELSLSLIPSNINCFGDNNGVVMSNVSGGTYPYTYSWNNGENLENISELTPGVYTLTVTDNKLCQIVDSVEVTEPNMLTITTNVTNVLCNGLNTGSIDATITGGVEPYDIAWNNGENTEVIENLFAGIYEMSVLDNHGCSTSIIDTVNEPDYALSYSAAVSDEILGGDGSIDLTVVGGTTPYAFTWSNSATDEDISNLAAGIYDVTITDANGCILEESFAVNAAICDLSLSVNTVDISCYGYSDGEAVAEITGGQSPFTYVWSTGGNTDSIGGLMDGNFSLTVSDVNSCTEIVSFVIQTPEPLLIDAVVNNVTCYGYNDGKIEITSMGGISPYSYNWSNTITTSINENLENGSYGVTVVDANGCVANASYEISQPDSIIISSSQNDVMCFGANNGSILTEAVGGVLPYDFAWNTGNNENELNNLVAGVYNVTITDANGCSNVVDFTLLEPEQLVITGVVTNESIGGDGAIDVTVTGGVLPYDYYWNTSDMVEDLSNLSSGIYNLTVVDANACSESNSFVVNDETCDLTVSISNTNVLCYGEFSGTASAIVTGGTSPYIYTWESGQTSSDLTNLAAGEYNVVVTDLNSCIAIASVEITEPEQIILTLSQTPTDGTDNGTATVNASGGTAGYTVLWDDALAQATWTAVDLSEGLYTVYVEDMNGCTASDTITVQLIIGVDGIVNAVEINAYPNPTFDKLNLNINSTISEDANIAIYDAVGKLILSQEIIIINGENHVEFNTSDFANGMYQLNINSNFIKQTIKFVKVSD